MEGYYATQYLDEKGYAYVEIMGEIYGPIQSGYLANQDLIKSRPICILTIQQNTSPISSQNKTD